MRPTYLEEEKYLNFKIKIFLIKWAVHKNKPFTVKISFSFDHHNKTSNI